MLRDLIDLFATPRSRVRRGHRSAAPMVQPPCDEVFAGFAAGAALQAEQRRGHGRVRPRAAPRAERGAERARRRWPVLAGARGRGQALRLTVG
jgi:hypothetical protein